MKISEILQGALDLIVDPVHWCQGAMALNVSGKAISPIEPTACKWCATGAIRKYGFDNDMDLGFTSPATEFLNKTTTLNSTYDDIVELNDNSSHNRVIQMMELAIFEAKEKNI